MMKSLLIVVIWTVLAAFICYLLFSPERGLMHAGPLAWVGAGMIGGAICVRARHSRCPVPDRSIHSPFGP